MIQVMREIYYNSNDKDTIMKVVKSVKQIGINRERKPKDRKKTDNRIDRHTDRL